MLLGRKDRLHEPEEGNAISPSALASRRQDDDCFPCGDDRPSRFTMLYFDFLELTFLPSGASQQGAALVTKIEPWP